MGGRDTPLLWVSRVDESQRQTRVAVNRLKSLKYIDEETKADKLTMTVDNFDLSQFEEASWMKGSVLRLSWGYAGFMRPKREVTVEDLSGGKVLTVTCNDKSMVMHKEKHSKTYEATRRSEIVHAIAKDYGYDADHRFVDETTHVFEHIVQAAETDAAFLMRMAKAEGFQFYVDFDGFHWHERKLDQRPAREYVYYSDPGRGDILDFDTVSTSKKKAKSKVGGKTAIEKAEVRAEGSNKETKRDGLAPTVDLIDTINVKTGEKARAEDVHVEQHPIPIGQTSMETTTEPHAAGAKKQADSVYKSHSLDAWKLKVKIVPDPNLVAKSVVVLKNLGVLSGRWYVTKVEEEIGADGGWKMEFECKREGLAKKGADKTKADENKKDPKKGDELDTFDHVNQRTGEKNRGENPVQGLRDNRGRE